MILTGPNGTGKSTLLAMITRGESVELLYEGLPRRLSRYLALLRAGAEREPERALEHVARGIHRNPRYEEELTRSHPATDDAAWLETVLGGEFDTRVSGMTITFAPRDRQHPPAVTLPVVPSSDPMQLWVEPSADEVTTLGASSAAAFQAWVEGVSAACGTPARGARNPLVMSVGGDLRTVLNLAQAWCEAVAARAARRFTAATGLECTLRCDPANSFLWGWRKGHEWLSPGDLSTGMRRWLSLSVLETLREHERMAAGAGEPCSWEELNSAPPAWAFPSSAVEVFAGEPYWLAVDEPELHLYPSEEAHLADALAKQASAGRMLLATHSLHLAAAFVGSADFVTFSGAGEFTVHEPTRVMKSTLASLSPTSPAILARVELLYVEGEWDVRIIEELCGDELAKRRVIVEPVHGVTAADKAITTVWTRMLGNRVWVLFDRLTEAQVDAEWLGIRNQLAAGVRRRNIAVALRGRAKRAGPREDRALLELLASVVAHQLEDRVHFLCHEMSDLLQVVHPRRFGFQAQSWAEAGYDGRQSFKTWYERRTGRNLDQDAWRAWRIPAEPQWDHDGIARLREALAPLLTPQ